MIFQKDVQYDKTDELIKQGMEYFNSPQIIKKPKPMLKMEDIDPFWVDFIKKHKIGTKISGVGIHCMRPGSESPAGHLHGKARGVYYLQTPDGVGDLTFPNLNKIVKPHKGLFVMVPAKELHAITKNTGKGIRLILAFYIE